MKIRLCLTALLFAIAVNAFPSISAAQPRASCPAGQTVQSINFAKHTVTCVPLPTGTPQSDAQGFYSSPSGIWVSVPIGTDFTDIQRFSSLPPGKYIVNASAALASQLPGFHIVDCVFKIGGSIQGQSRGIIGSGNFNNFITLPLTIGFEIETPQDLAVACRSEVSGMVVSQASPITAIRVNRLTVETGFQP